MKENFNQQVEGVSPEQTRAALMQGEKSKKQGTLVEQTQPFPELKPHGLGEGTVDRQHFNKKLNQEHNRVQRYQVRISELHTRIFMNGQLVDTKIEREVTPINRTRHTTHDFNMSAAFEHDMKELGISY